MMIFYLPPDLVDEILSKVPATPLKRLRSTCKRWNALFKDQRFSEKHCREAEKQSQIVMLKGSRVFPMSANLNLDVAPPSVEFKGALSLKDSSQEVEIAEVFHCDGLLLCTTDDKTLVVWNPCSGETRWVVQPQTGYETFSSFALGYQINKSCRSYKILRCWESKYKPEIYELGSDLWRVLDDMALDCFLGRSAVSSTGNTFWIATDRKDHGYRFVVCFDFTKERFKRLSLPQFQNPGYIQGLSVVREEQLSVLNQCFDLRKMEIWVTNKIDTEAALSWSLSFTVNFQNIFCKLPLFIESFLIDEEKVVWCCNAGISGNMVYTIGENNDYFYTQTPYVEESTNKSWPFIFNYVPSLVHIQLVL